MVRFRCWPLQLLSWARVIFIMIMFVLNVCRRRVNKTSPDFLFPRAKFYGREYGGRCWWGLMMRLFCLGWNARWCTASILLLLHASASSRINTDAKNPSASFATAVRPYNNGRRARAGLLLRTFCIITTFPTLLSSSSIYLPRQPLQLSGQCWHIEREKEKNWAKVCRLRSSVKRTSRRVKSIRKRYFCTFLSSSSSFWVQCVSWWTYWQPYEVTMVGSYDVINRTFQSFQAKNKIIFKKPDPCCWISGAILCWFERKKKNALFFFASRSYAPAWNAIDCRCV